MGGFVDYFVEQGFVGHLIAWTGAALAFTVLVVGIATLIARRGRDAGHLKALAFAAGAALIAFAAGVVVFEAVALYTRRVPYGEGPERRGENYEAFVFQAKLVLALAAGLGWVLARRHGERGPWLPTAATAAVVAFMVLSLRAVEFMNACDVGRPFVLDTRC
ncbi:MAG: hypothetical protein ABR583_02010 [Gaiellaceae bacterium]